MFHVAQPETSEIRMPPPSRDDRIKSHATRCQVWTHICSSMSECTIILAIAEYIVNYQDEFLASKKDGDSAPSNVTR